ncbi:DUF6530 family protein [[Flexibacter] sp. ATCC 35208]|uniref:DUF6530 family protein n=1 Tax=[Flexibacter] sp. ATCC 35208 TaxID=1936242 RepID=UPI0009CAC22D|nr:DUF6530 family protein [[Flexibacter] sp. ATCC 35208]OMP74962.1 hypothetical protein BW716_32580 [[Flexibacter] sp. ATCC 35208]
MTVPEHLQHKPIIAVNDYDKIDGQYAPNSDAKVLSIGQAQYDEDEISVKVFRHTGNNWSRQSEELPLHRTLDLTTLIITSILTGQNSAKIVSTLNEQIISEPRVQEIKDYYQANINIIRPKLEEIRDLLNTLL